MLSFCQSKIEPRSSSSNLAKLFVLVPSRRRKAFRVYIWLWTSWMAWGTVVVSAISLSRTSSFQELLENKFFYSLWNRHATTRCGNQSCFQDSHIGWSNLSKLLLSCFALASSSSLAWNICQTFPLHSHISRLWWHLTWRVYKEAISLLPGSRCRKQLNSSKRNVCPQKKHRNW